MLLGTAAYMSPEQAKGKPADRRADVWSFGVVLFEMLTGRRAFAGEDVSDTLALVLTKEPDWSALPPGLPGRLRGLLTRCLTKDPKKRLQAIGEARITIENPGEATPKARTSFWPALAGAAAMGLRLGALGGVAAAGNRSPPAADASPASSWVRMLPSSASWKMARGPFFLRTEPSWRSSRFRARTLSPGSTCGASRISRRRP